MYTYLFDAITLSVNIDVKKTAIHQQIGKSISSTRNELSVCMKFDRSIQIDSKSARVELEEATRYR